MKELPTRSRYRTIEVRMWGDEKFCELTPIPPCGQGLWVFLLTGPHTGQIPGVFRATRGGLADDLGWSLEAFDKAFEEAFRQGMAKADWKAKLVWIPKAIEINKPASPNVVISWGKEWDLMPDCALKDEALESIKAFVCGLGEAFVKAFVKAFAKPLAKALAKASGKPSGKPMAIQEQEQEQEGTNKGRQLTSAVDNSQAVDNFKGETTTDDDLDDHQNQNPQPDGPALSVSLDWLLEHKVKIEPDNALLAGWAKAGVTARQFELAVTKAKEYKLAHIPANYLASIINEMLTPPERASPRPFVGNDLASVQAAARSIGLDDGRIGEQLPEYRRRVLEAMDKGRQAA